MDWDAFFTVHSDLPREGPGEPADVYWALKAAEVSGAISVLDAGAGPGADTVTLAQALPDAQITSVEKHPGFVAQARSRLEQFGSRVAVVEGDMAELEGRYDFIWCAGALYFLGVTEGLSLWRSALTKKGVVAFSEPVLLNGSLTGSAKEFWNEYPAITDETGIIQRINSAGYRVIDKRVIVGEPWRAYYDPLKERIAALRDTDPSPNLVRALDENAREIALWEAAPEQIAYMLFVVRPA